MLNKLKIIADYKLVKEKFGRRGMSAIIAHRGASFDFPENSIAAFIGAREQAADGVELDVRRTSDRVLVVCHDPITPSGIAIADAKYSLLSHELCTLSEALAACGSLTVNVEIKNQPDQPGFDPSPDLAESVLETCSESSQAILISSFNPVTLDQVRACAGATGSGLLCVDPAGSIDQCRRAGHVAVHPYDAFVTLAFVREAHDYGIAVNVWTVDEPARIAELASWEVDGIITNRPAFARSVLGA